MDLDMMNHEEIMRAISQLDRALACLSSPSTSPPRQPQLVHHVPSDPLFPPVRTPPAEHSAAARQQQLVRVVDAAARPRRRPRNMRVSSEPQSVAARLRRERVSQRMRALQRLVPGGARLDTASMLEEAIRYVRFLKSHVQALEQLAAAAAQDRVVDVTAAGGFYSCLPYHA